MIRTALFIGALLLAGGAYVVATVARIDATTRGVLRRMEADGMATLTFSTTLDDGTVVTYTATQQQGESLEDFAARARREWAAILAGLGQ